MSEPPIDPPNDDPYDDERAAQGHAANFMIFYRNAPPDVQAKLEVMWREAGLGNLPEGTSDEAT